MWNFASRGVPRGCVPADVHHNLRMRRRTWIVLIAISALIILAGLAWIAITQSGLLQPSHWEQPAEPIPVISTRGHLKNGKLTAGHTSYDYDIEGDMPGLAEGSLPPPDLLIVAHGFNNTAEKALYKFAIARDSLVGGGYEGAFAGFSWDANTQTDPLAMTGYHEGMRNAAASGFKLARFVSDYKRDCPDTRIHLLGYSMGALVVLEALKALDDDPTLASDQVLVSSVHLAGASVGNDEVELGQRYGRAIEHSCGTLYNYFSPEDNKLGYYYPLKEGGSALGLTGIKDPQEQPRNYVDVYAVKELPALNDKGVADVDEYGDNHSGYLGTRNKSGELIDDGILDLVAQNIAQLASSLPPDIPPQP